jgi:hypothetical protein
MDLASLGGGRPDRALADLVWPSDYAAYDGLSRHLIDTQIETVRALGLAGPFGAALRAKTYDMATDLAFVARLSFDIANARRTGRTLQYDPQSSPMLAFLDSGGDARRFPMPRVWHHPLDNRVATRARSLARRSRSYVRALLAGGSRIDVHNRNNLVNAFLASDDRAAVEWPVTDHGWPDGSDLPPPLVEAAAALSDAYLNTVRQFVEDTRLCDTLAVMGHSLARYHLTKAWADLMLFQRHIRRRPLGTMLLSGTPKHLGRLAGWLYREEGRPVARCAHGGERVFFADYEWGLAEFPDCDIYFAHSAGERDAIRQRLDSGGTARVLTNQTIDVRTLGSPHHQSLLKRSRERGQRPRSGTLLYVAGGYLGEQLGDFPSRKPPDILYLDWQIDLIETLKSFGYRVVAKLHPAGIAREARYLGHYTDGIVEGLFDPTAVDADCFVFDFAGTAFFDAIATQTPMVLADTTVRPFDLSTLDDLATRCPIVPGRRDEAGRFRIDRERLGAAIEDAIARPPCPADFYDRYLGA